MLTFKEIASTRDFRRNSLFTINYNHTNFFEVAIEENIKALKEKIELSEKRYRELSNIIYDNDTSNYTYDEIEMLVHEACYHEGNIESSWQHLRALNEMRVIYLFKNLEISIKSIIKDAYPTTNTREFFKWQNLIDFLKEKNIPVTTIDGYTDALQLKDVNNALKHSETVPQHLIKISEFISGFNSEGLEQFAQRVRPRVEIFRVNLSKEIAKERYDFDEGKIDAIVKEYHHRMDSEAFLAFIQKLSLKSS